MRRRFYQLDVFTTRPYRGNPLAVITDGDGLSRRRMQDIAREMNLSETVFVQRPTAARALARLRIFTTEEELPLAGHPVIGTWFLLAELGVVPARDGAVHVMQQTGAGVLPVEIVFRDGRPARVTMTQQAARFRRPGIFRAALARALGLRLADLHAELPVEAVSTGVFHVLVPLRSRAALRRIRASQPELKRVLGNRGVLAYCFALGGRGRAYARGMAPWGLVEDPVTGSASGCLGAYLVRHGRLRAGQRLTVTQGVEMGRPGQAQVEVLEGGGRLVPRVSGAAVRVLEGHIEA